MTWSCKYRCPSICPKPTGRNFVWQDGSQLSNLHMCGLKLWDERRFETSLLKKDVDSLSLLLNIPIKCFVRALPRHRAEPCLLQCQSLRVLTCNFQNAFELIYRKYSLPYSLSNCSLIWKIRDPPPTTGSLIHYQKNDNNTKEKTSPFVWSHFSLDGCPSHWTLCSRFEASWHRFLPHRPGWFFEWLEGCALQR